jgi:N-acetylneuraminic acid mutarotase
LAGGPACFWRWHAFAQATLQQVTAPGWSRTGSLNTGRMNYTATLLSNGKVLVAGGINCAFDYLNSAELYDPTTETWSYTGSLNMPRRGHSATLLPNGKVLVAGGEYGTDQFLDDAEL